MWRIYGEDPDVEARLVPLAIDSYETRSSAESHVGEIVFRAP